MQVLIRGFIAINEKSAAEAALEQQNSRTKAIPAVIDAVASHAVPIEKSASQQGSVSEARTVPEDAAAARDAHSLPGDRRGGGGGSNSHGDGGSSRGDSGHGGASDNKGGKDAFSAAHSDPRFELANELQTDSRGDGGDGDGSDSKAGKDASSGARTDARFELANELQTGSVDDQAELLSPVAKKAATEGALLGVASKDASVQSV